MLSPGAGRRSGGRHTALGYSDFMFEVLVYLYENYWRPDACPDPKLLSRKLSAVGFETEEIQDALRWLDGLASTAQACTGTPVPGSMRIYTDGESEVLGEASIGFIVFASMT